MKKVHLMWLGHKDYLDENTAAVRTAIKTSLIPLNSALADSEIVITENSQAITIVRTAIQQDACGAILILLTWAECDVIMTTFKELRALPCVFWGFPIEEVEGRQESTGSCVTAAMFSGTIKRLQLSTEMLIGSWKEKAIQKKLQAFVRAASAANALFYGRIGLFGYTSMSIYPGTFEHVLLRFLIGPEVEQLDSYSLITSAQSIPEEQIEKTTKQLALNIPLAPDIPPQIMQRTIALYLALKNFCKNHQWDAVNIKCQYEFSKEYRTVPCVALSMLADDGITASCEGDIPNTVSMMILHFLSGSVVTYGDALSWKDNVVTFSPCGFLPLSMGASGIRIQNFMKHPGFSGIQVCGVLRPEKVTYLRLVEDIGNFHILYGIGNGLNTQPRSGCMPALDVELDGSIETFRKTLAGQHYAIAYGDFSEEIDMLASLLNIPTIRV